MKDKGKLIFAPGCFDNFNGTQEELDALVAELIAKFESGELIAESEEIDLDSLDPEEAEELLRLFGESDTDTPSRLLH